MASTGALSASMCACERLNMALPVVPISGSTPRPVSDITVHGQSPAAVASRGAEADRDAIGAAKDCPARQLKPVSRLEATLPPRQNVLRGSTPRSQAGLRLEGQGQCW